MQFMLNIYDISGDDSGEELMEFVVDSIGVYQPMRDQEQ